MEVQEFLCGGGSLQELENKLAIKHKRHNKYPHILSLKYNQIDSPMGDPIVQECRGLILDENNNWKIVARGLNKFFNYGEGYAAKILWNNTTRTQEKIDGSFCLLYFYNNEWHVATTGTPDASGNVGDSGKSFANYFWETLGDRFDFQASGANNFCFMFELTGPLNRVVVPHTKADLTLLGARQVGTWNEVHQSVTSHFFPSISVVKEFSLQSIQEITDTFSTMSPLKQEGYVIVWVNPDGSFGRVKTKHPGYQALHHAKNGFTIKTFVENVRTGETSEFVTAFPEYLPLIEEVKNRYNILLLSLHGDYEKFRHIESQKDFALAIKDNSRCGAALFALRAGKVRSFREFLAEKTNIDSLMVMLGYTTHKNNK